MKVADLGEFGVIHRLTKLIHERRKRSPYSFGCKLLVDTGDDAAAWKSGGATELFTTDTMVEGVHFTQPTIPWQDLGWKAMAVNLSDIAAMGGLPLYALVTLGIPSNFRLDDLDMLYKGALDAAEEFGFSIIGGDMVRSPVTFVTVALIGATQGTPMTRCHARLGHQVAVTGHLGSSAGGLETLRLGEETGDAHAQSLIQAHRRPRPHLKQGRTLALAGVKAAMDVSDGLLDDLSKLCGASHVSAQINAHQLPIVSALQDTFPQSYQHLALTGGEDYVLLFTAEPQTMELVLPQLSGNPAIIGQICAGEPGRVQVLDHAGKDITPVTGGWDHYR